MKPLINVNIIMIILLGTVASLCVLLVGCSMASPLVTNPNFMYWCLCSAGFIIVVITYLICKIQEYQQLCNKFIED